LLTLKIFQKNLQLVTDVKVTDVCCKYKSMRDTAGRSQREEAY
jgi:hypothetical protein